MDINAPYPAEVALTDDGDKGYLFRTCPGNMRLYTYDGDSAGRSACTGDCERLWLPVIAPTSARTLGDWNTVHRADGRLQWAYRGRPVYTLIHDAPYAPKGDGQEDGKWHLLPHEK